MTRMKESGIDWIGQIPEEWEVKGIKHIFEEIGSGTTPKSDNETFYDGDINWIQSGDLYQTDEVIKVSKTITYQGFQSTSALKIYQQPFIALAMYGASVGNVAISCIDACVNQAVVVMLGTSEKVRFGKYAIEASKNNLIFSAQGGTQPNISQNLIKNWNIPQPDSSEQTKIADFLDKKTAQLDKVKALLEEQIQKLKDYRASLIYETVTKGLDKTVPMKDSGINWIGEVPEGWGVKRLKYLVNKIGSGKTPLGGSEIFEETGILFIRSQNVHNGLIQLEDKSTYINRNIHRQMIGTSVEKNDILLNITGASIGRVAKYDLDVEANVNQHVCIIRCDRFVLPDYLMYFIMSEFGQFMIKIHQISGNREGLSFDNIGNFKIIIPDLDYQYKISQYLNKKMLIINQMIKTKDQQIENINKQRQTLIYDYVTGKRRV